jgi:D-alanyl-D-alanine carboxypeptidase
MRALTLSFVLAIAASVSSAQWAEGESMLARKATFDARLTIPFASLVSTPQTTSPADRFILKPDNNGYVDFDPDLARRFQRAIDSVGGKYGVQGMSAAVLIPGQGVWLGTYGYSTTAPDSIRPATIFNVASQTKTFTSVLLLKLVEEGKLALDDSIGRYLINLPSSISGRITIRQLLNMTSGVYDFINDNLTTWKNAVLANTSRYWSPEEILTSFALTQSMTPGSSWWYSNTNAVLAGMIARNVSQKTISAQLHERILTPLSMAHTYFGAEDSLVGPIAHPWRNGVDVSPWYGPSIHSTLWTAGAMYSTAEEMVRWLNSLYGGQVLTPASLAQMQTGVLIPVQDRLSGAGISEEAYGLCAIRYTFLGKPLWGHTGSFYGYASMGTYYPEKGVGVALLSNWRVETSSLMRVHVFECVSAFYHEYLRTISTAGATPGKVYALSGGGDGARTYTLDTSSATLKEVGQYRYGDIVSCRIHPKTGELWGLANALGWELVRIDGVTGEAYPKAKISLPSGFATDLKGIDFLSDDSLYVGSVDGRIYAVDTRGGGGRLALSSGIPISGLAFQPKTGNLWASIRISSSLRDRIYRINLKTGDTLGVGNTQLPAPLMDIAFSQAEDLLGVLRVGAVSPDYRLARIDTATGKGTEVGSFGATSIQALAFSPAVTDVERIVIAERPAGFSLHQNYPNPFNPATVVSYQLPVASSVRLVVYDVLGREVTTLVDENKPAGVHTVQFEARDLASGVYLYRMQAGNFSSARKFIFMK